MPKAEISFLDSIYTDKNNEIRATYPVNLVPIVNGNAISDKYLRITDGIIDFQNVFGIDRGGINWNGKHIRVCGSKLVELGVDGGQTIIHDVGAGGAVVFDYSFDYLAINSNDALYLYDGKECKKVTDADLGKVNDFVYIDGYFLVTDGEFIVATDINDPFSVSDFNYGSSEFDVDPIIALYKLGKELYALNRYSIEAFKNVGGSDFPFLPISGSHINKGAISRDCSCNFLDTICFIGGGRNEPVSIYLMAGSTATQISNRDIDLILSELTEDEIKKNVTIEARSTQTHDWLYLHLKDRTLVYDYRATIAHQKPVWYQLNSGISDKDTYLARNFVLVHDKWFVGHPTAFKIGYFSDDVTTQWGNKIRWQFDTQPIYNQGIGVILNALEITTVSSSIPITANPTVALEISYDANFHGEKHYVSLGKTGQRSTRAIWRRLGYVDNLATFRISGDSNDRISIMRLDIDFESTT